MDIMVRWTNVVRPGIVARNGVKLLAAVDEVRKTVRAPSSSKSLVVGIATHTIPFSVLDSLLATLSAGSARS